MMNAPLSLLYPRLYQLTEEYRPTEAQMPIAYQNIPGGRPLHDDWALFKSTPRILTARRIPLPLKQISGNRIPTWMLWDPSYPTVPGTQIMDREYYPGCPKLPHALVDCAGYGWSEFAAYLHDEWVPCFKQYHGVFFGKRLSFYNGLKQDVTVAPPDATRTTIKSDLMGWLEPAMSFVKETPV